MKDMPMDIGEKTKAMRVILDRISRNPTATDAALQSDIHDLSLEVFLAVREADVEVLTKLVEWIEISQNAARHFDVGRSPLKTGLIFGSLAFAHSLVSIKLQDMYEHDLVAKIEEGGHSPIVRRLSRGNQLTAKEIAALLKMEVSDVEASLSFLRGLNVVHRLRGWEQPAMALTMIGERVADIQRKSIVGEPQESLARDGR
jgi:predicted transcriptional regulator